jgi:hypothetical protein
MRGRKERIGSGRDRAYLCDMAAAADTAQLNEDYRQAIAA